MRPVSETITIDVPRERVFDLLCDLSIRPAFTGHFLSGYRLLRVDPVGVGAGARFQLHESGEWMDTTIEQTERPSLIRERGRGGRLNRIPAFTVWELAEGPAPGSTELTLTFWTEPSNPFDRAKEMWGATRWFGRNWRRALGGLRELAESEREPERVAIGGADRVA